jgi:hypothetical protein
MRGHSNAADCLRYPLTVPGKREYDWCGEWKTKNPPRTVDEALDAMLRKIRQHGRNETKPA